MPSQEGYEWIFDSVADTYEKFRPGYVPQLYKVLFDYIPIDRDSNVLEIGIGSGQATLPFLKTGCRLTAVEYGENFSDILKDKFGEYENFSVITGKFEDTDAEDDAYDLIFAATSFHWIPEKEGYEKVYSMLKKGGAFARFANHPHPNKNNSGLADEIESLYDKYYYTWHNKKREPLREYTEEQAAEIADTAKKYGFTDIEYKLFFRERTFSAEEYIQLLGTYSDHMAIEGNIRNEFFSEIAKAINDHGGELTISDTIDLQLARK